MAWSLLALIQGIYFILTGIWPLLHIKSFEKVTGPKNDHWLVKTVGGLTLMLGFFFVYFGLHGENFPRSESALVASLSPITYLWVDVYYASKKVISKIYFLDAVIEILFLLSWTWLWISH